MKLLASAVALLAAAAVAAPAQAATPESGTVSPDQTVVKWSGEAAGSLVQYAHFFNGSQVVDDCSPPICDVFTLTVAPTPEGSRLKVSLEDETGYTEVQIRDESGEEVFYSVGQETGPTVWAKTNPKPGAYTVEVLTDALAPAPVDDPSYTGKAELTLPEVAETPPPAATPTEPAAKKKKSCKKKKTKKARKRCRKKQRG